MLRLLTVFSVSAADSGDLNCVCTAGVVLLWYSGWCHLAVDVYCALWRDLLKSVEGKTTSGQWDIIFTLSPHTLAVISAFLGAVTLDETRYVGQLYCRFIVVSQQLFCFTVHGVEFYNFLTWVVVSGWKLEQLIKLNCYTWVRDCYESCFFLHCEVYFAEWAERIGYSVLILSCSNPNTALKSFYLLYN